MSLKLGASLLLVSTVIAACNAEKTDTKASADKSADKKSSAQAHASGSAEAKVGKSAEAKPTTSSASPAASASAAPAASSADAPTEVVKNDVTHPNLGTPEKPVLTPTQQTYALDGIKTISDTCSTAYVNLAQAPESVGVDYDWTFTRQAMLANQQYRVVDGEPKAPGEVSFQVHQADAKMQNAFVLIARCADGVTCNHLAAMYKAVVKSANPQPFCGDVPAQLGAKKKSVNLLAGGPEANLPADSDARAKCARVAACTIADKTDTKDDIGIACQKSPTSYKLECAKKYPCAEVLACMK